MNKRLYKSKNRLVCGVCAGVAEYFNIDPTIIRLIWALLIAAGGTGLVAYLICAFVFPERPSDSADWDNMKRTHEPTEKDEEFDSYFKKEKEAK
mgnify:CR=1 FL=1